VQEKYGRDAFDKGFTELTGIKSDPTKPAQFLGELVSLGGVAKTGVKGAKLVGETISDTYKGAKKLFEDSTLPPPDNLAAQTAGAGQFKQTDTLLDKTKSDTSISTEIPSLKTEDLANKPTINPSIIGVETELGQKQIASYEKLIKDSKVLGGKPPSPQRLFERTGVYKGSDGKYRYDLDDRDAEFNTSFLEKSLVKNPNMKNPPIMLSNSIVSYRHLQPKLFTLREVLDFDSLYKQYPKTLKVKDKVYSNIGNVKVKFISGKSGTRGSYDGDTDTITLNITDSSGQQITDLGKIESTLLHEVQHAIQRREGFLRGGNNETMLDKINPNHSKELKEANDELSNKLTLLKDNLSTGFDNIQPFKHTDGSTYNSTEAINYAAGQISKIAYAKALKDKDAVKILEENISSFLENSNFPKGIQQKITKNADNIFFDIQVKRSKLDKETRQSFEEYENLYGEKEARLVQKRYEKRKKFKAMSGGLDFGEDKITNIMRKDTSFIDDMTKKEYVPNKEMYDGIQTSVIEFPQTPRDRIKAKRKFDLERTKLRQEDARKVSDEQLKTQSIKIAEAHAPMAKLLGAEETNRIMNSTPKFTADGTDFAEDSLLLKNLSDRYTEEVLNKINPDIKWLSLPNAYKQNPFKKYKDGDVLRNADGETIKIELTSHLPVKDKKLHKNPNVVNVHKEYYIEPTYILNNGGYARLTDLEANGYKRVGKPDLSVVSDTKKMNKGGDMKRQMDLFQEGGLKDEGGTVDPVSGNDVPPGSTQEEVRDDIPAQLSEGEFVFPADVVRFIGLEKLMTLRQEAKAGLKRMEEMGQMGNSEEATLPDDMPFTIDDLDMEDEQEYNQGGVVQAQTGTFVAPGAGITTTPSQFAGQALSSTGNISNYVAPNIPPLAPAPIGGFRPLTTSAQIGQQNRDTTPTFQTLLGNKPGQYDELREYVNEAGMKLKIPFKNGQPIYPIPEGYTFVDPEATETDDPTTISPLIKTTRVVEQSDGPQEPRTGRITLSDPNNKKTGQKTLEIDLISDSKYSESGSGYSITDPNTGATVQLSPTEAAALNASGIQSGSLKANTDFKSGVPEVLRPILNRLETENNIISLSKTKAGKELEELLNPEARKNIVEKLFSMNTLKIIGDVISGRATKSKQYEQAVREVQEKIANQPKENQKDIIEETNKLIKDTFEITDDGDFKQLKGKTDAQKRATPVFNMKDGKRDTVDYGGKTGLSISEYGDIKNKEAEAVAKQERDFAEYQSYQSGDNDSDPNDGYSGDPSPAEDDPNMNKGGLAGKKKPKVKKMKRGGLASR